MAVRGFAPDHASEFVRTVLTRLDVPLTDAEITADSLVSANLRGVHSHGVGLLPIYVRRLERGVIQPHPSIRVLHSGLAYAALDGDNGLGPVVGARAMDVTEHPKPATGGHVKSGH
jgi:LDH2 family malate/lactate/ureidoglycolate dehydrogenase